MYRDPAKEVLMHAMVHLLNRKSISHIRLSDILLESGVSKSTFYRNFIDKYELMNYCFSRMMEDSLSGMKQVSYTEKPHAIINVLQSNRQFFLNGLYDLNGEDPLKEYVYDYIYKFYEQQYLLRKDRSRLLTYEKLAVICAAGGFLRILEEWLKRPELLDLTDPEIANLEVDLLPDVLKCVCLQNN